MLTRKQATEQGCRGKCGETFEKEIQELNDRNWEQFATLMGLLGFAVMYFL